MALLSPELVAVLSVTSELMHVLVLLAVEQQEKSSKAVLITTKDKDKKNKKQVNSQQIFFFLLINIIQSFWVVLSLVAEMWGCGTCPAQIVSP